MNIKDKEEENEKKNYSVINNKRSFHFFARKIVTWEGENSLESD